MHLLLLVDVSDGLSADPGFHRQALETQSRLLDHPALFTVAHSLLQHLHFAVQVDFFFFFFDDEGGLGDCLTVLVRGSVLLLHLVLVRRGHVLVLMVRLLLIGGLSVGLAVEHHLLPRLVVLEHREHFFVLLTVYLRRVHECSKPQTVVLEAALVGLGDPKGLDNTLVFELEGGLGGTILDHAEHLHV